MHLTVLNLNFLIQAGYLIARHTIPSGLPRVLVTKSVSFHQQFGQVPRAANLLLPVILLIGLILFPHVVNNSQ